MPFQASWVEHWLDKYCAPGQHLLVPSRAGLATCVRCGKDELTSTQTCMICGIPGEVPAELASLSSPGQGRVGKLCGICRDEFAQRHAIRDWYLRRA